MRKFVFLILVLFPIVLGAQQDSLLPSRMESILSVIPRGTRYGLMIYDPASEKTLFERNSTMPIKPASNVKLFTTGIALAMLGGDFQLSTRLFTDDMNTSDGIINGDLYIKGFGNSLFTDDDIDSLVAYIRSSGIRRITGRVIGDDSYFDSVYHRRDWIIEELSSVPLPPVSALVINRNQFTLRVSSSGGGIQYNFSPRCDLFDVELNVQKTRKRNSGIRISQDASTDRYRFNITGTLGRRGYSATRTFEIENPPLFAAYLLEDRLIKAGIAVDKKPAAGVMPQTGCYELSSRSIRLKDLIKTINKRSDNFLAECLFKTIGAEYSESQGNAFYATQAVLSYLNSNGIYSEGTSLVDGSGISHFNQATAAAVVDLLDKMYYNPMVYNDYYTSLSVAGVDGTLRGRLWGTAGANNLHGKTGTLHGVTALSGYVRDRQGRDLIVSMLFEYQTGYAGLYKNVQDRIILALTN